MYDKLRENLPLQESLFSQDDWLHVCGWNKFYANSRGFDYLPVYTDEKAQEFIGPQDDLTGLTLSGYREYQHDDDDVLQNDLFEAASDLSVGVNNGISFILAITLLIEEINLSTSLFIAFGALFFQSLLRALFNWFEYHNTQNANRNKFVKVFLAIFFTFIAIIALTLLIIATVTAMTAVINALPFVVFAVGAARAILHIGLIIANLALFFAYATNPFERERYLNQAWKRTIQAVGALAVTLVAGLILFKQISVSSISLPITISLAILSVGAFFYSTCREYEPIRSWKPLRFIFKAVNERFEFLSKESIADKIERYEKAIAAHQSTEQPETRMEKLFYHGGGMIEELNIIRDCDFYKDKRKRTTVKNINPTPEQKQAARLFLKGILLAKIADNQKEYTTLTDKTDFRLFRQRDLKNNAYKTQFLACLLRLHENDGLIKVKNTPLTTVTSFDDVTNLTQLNYLLRVKPDIRLGIFSALNRKHSNAETIWRVVLEYSKLFEAPIKALTLSENLEPVLEQTTTLEDTIHTAPPTEEPPSPSAIIVQVQEQEEQERVAVSEPITALNDIISLSPVTVTDLPPSPSASPTCSTHGPASILVPLTVTSKTFTSGANLEQVTY